MSVIRRRRKSLKKKGKEVKERIKGLAKLT